MSWYKRIGEKKGPPTHIYEVVTVVQGEPLEDPPITIYETTDFAHAPLEDIVWAYINAGYTPAEVLQVPEVKFFYQKIHQKKVRKILERRRAFRKRSHEWFQKQLDAQT